MDVCINDTVTIFRVENGYMIRPEFRMTGEHETRDQVIFSTLKEVLGWIGEHFDDNLEAP